MYASRSAVAGRATGTALSSARLRLPIFLGALVLGAGEALAVQPPAVLPARVEEDRLDPDGPWTTLATSVEGRPIRLATIGHGPRRVLWVGGIHGDEREGARATAELPAAF